MKLLYLIITLMLIGGSMAIAKDGSGSATISFNGQTGSSIEVPCGAVGAWEINYTVPEGGIAVGGGVKIFRIPNKYWLGQCKQAEDPKAWDYLTVKRTDGGPVEISYIGRFYKDHREAEVVIKDKPMAAGEKIVITFGDKSGGSIGAEVPYSWQPPSLFEVQSDLDGDGTYQKLPRPLTVIPVSGKPAKFVVSVPLITAIGEVAQLHIRAEDKGSNLADQFTEEVTLSCTDSKAKFADKMKFESRDKGVKTAAIVFSTPGIHYVTVKSSSGIESCSNPSKVDKDPIYRIYWGDLHCHTEESDGTGSMEFNYEYARDITWMDFMGVTDHLVWDDKGGPAISCDGPIKRTMEEWNNRQSAMARKYCNPGEFVTFLGYEWSGGSEKGGDHNVYYMDDTSRVKCAPNLNDEFKDLASRGERAAFILPHVGGRIADPKWHDPIVQPSLEINSMHGHFEWFAQEWLQKGYKMGINGGSDGHFGLPGNDIWANHGRLGMERRDVSVPQGTTCAYATSLTREGIRNSLFERRTYATTNVKMLLEVTMDGHLMGSEYTSDKRPKMYIVAAGTGDIGRVEIIRNQERIFNKTTDSKVVKISFTDDQPVQGTSYYYVRVSQKDGEIAWSSPIFFTYTGEQTNGAPIFPAWNSEYEADELGDPVTKDHLPDLLDHLKWRAPDNRFYSLKQVRMIHNPRGDYALFYGYDKQNGGGKIHIRWYVGFDTPRIHISRGWRDFGSERE